MAKRMAYTDPETHATYPASVWLPLVINTNFAVPSGRIQFLGYATEAIARAKLLFVLGLGGRDAQPIGVKTYSVSPAQVRAFAAGVPAGPTRLDDDAGIAYAVAADSLDTDPTTRLPSASPDAVSFFDGAADVDLLAS